MYRTEGLFSFWKGILPPILVETPKRAWKFLTFEQFKTLFNFGGKDAPPTAIVIKYLKILCTLRTLLFKVFHIHFQTYSLAGLGSGVTEAIIVNPFEAIKVRMQSNRFVDYISHDNLTVFIITVQYMYVQNCLQCIISEHTNGRHHRRQLLQKKLSALKGFSGGFLQKVGLDGHWAMS